ncbi:MAG TPA: malto-oligosyltrehalose trehalohydrolase [Candidatus Methylomirabilis sp.]|nr:malto-oligosyltrehalose trehalohydrolase [Candidatus Methylomirabilis sp.]
MSADPEDHVKCPTSPFSVWAPGARNVDVDLGDARMPMTRGDHGWWTLALASAGGRVDYRFVLDGGQPLPDPRSPSQPFGVHGPSRVVDHHDFRWSDQDWQPRPLERAVIYELHVGTFTPVGTFDAAIDRLDHLVDLGITHVELMPVAEFPGQRGWGYDGVDLYAPHHGYGGPDGLKRLVNACHTRGLAVLLDVVYNHLGPAGNYLARFGPYFSDRYRTPWGEAVNLDGPESDEVRRFLCDNALMWLRDYRIDGLRIDAAHALYDQSATPFLEQLATEVDRLGAQLGRHLVLIAESDLNDPKIVRPAAIGGYGLDAVWNEDFHHALHAVLTGERAGYYADFGGLTDVASALRDGFVYGGRYSAYRRRRHGRAAGGLGGRHFIGFLQNHDQVGNRARGERLSRLVSPARLKIGAALVLTGPFVPMLFQGEEWGASMPFQYFTDHEDPALGRAVSEGRRRGFTAFGIDGEDVPDPQAAETFRRSKLDWTERGRDPHAGMLEWYRRLIGLRRDHPELADGRLEQLRVSCDEAERWLCVERGPFTIACNLGQGPHSLPLGRPSRVVLASDPGVTLTVEAVALPPESVTVLGP